MFLLLLGAYLIISITGFNNTKTPDHRKIAGASTVISTAPSGPEISLSQRPAQTPTSTPTPKTKQYDDTDIHVYPYKTTNDLLQQINSFRSSKGLAHLTANSETCFFANLRSQEIISAFNHDGFRNRIDSKTLPYPSYSSVAENIAMNSDANQVVPGWINSPGHIENLLKDVPYGCVVSNGNYFVFEAWKPNLRY